MSRPPDDLPINGLLPAILASLETCPNLVLEAPPGAGKTTGVPLALLTASWRGDGKILMLEPRRLAAKAAARRMAAMLGERPGQTVGYRVRMDSQVSARTRIEIMTDGIFTRLIQDDPALDGVAAVLFDEFHERRLETDLGLALSLDAQAQLRPELRLVAMSATLDLGPIAALMNDAPVLRAEGRAYPVTIRHLPGFAPRALPGAIADAVDQALETPGDILVFLPGTREIRRVQRLLNDNLPPTIDVLPLFGDLDQAAQDCALAPAAPGRRKIILATSIAETSLTIDGVTQVIDSGLSRQSRFETRTGMSRLETIPVSQAGATQRAGRAGRTAPGQCWRLWPEAAHRGLRPQPSPEIALADLTPFVLELAAWGIHDPSGLRLLDPPPASSFAAARRLLLSLGALDQDGKITAHGREMARIGLSPRLAHMILRAGQRHEGVLACAIAALLSERDPGGERGPDLRARLERLSRDPVLFYTREVAKRLCRQADLRWQTDALDPSRAGAILSLAYPDRIAQRRGSGGRFLLSGGPGAVLPESDPLAAETFLAVAELDGQPPNSRIYLAAPLTLEELEESAADNIVVERSVRFEPSTGTVQARQRRKFGALVLSDMTLDAPDPTEVTAALLDGIRDQGLRALPWTSAARTLQARVALLAKSADGYWPDLTDASLAANLGDWLGGHLRGKRSLADLAKLDLHQILADQLEWDQRRDLDTLAPTHITVPSGSRIAIDYDSGDQPVLAVKLQELFGLGETPSIAKGRIKLALHLLSPAMRPIQVTSDLPGFWTGSYKAVRADLRGRYPKHPWPEDPMSAQPTARAKPRKI